MKIVETESAHLPCISSSSSAETIKMDLQLDLMKEEKMSTGTGNTIVLFFSAEMLFRVCR